MANLSTARSPKPAAQRERGWNILNRRSRNLDPLSRHGRNGEGETVSLRSVREALQESEWAEIPPAACTSLQPRIEAKPAKPGRRPKQPTRDECQCGWSRHGGYGYWDVLRCVGFFLANLHTHPSNSFARPPCSSANGIFGFTRCSIFIQTALFSS